MMIFEGLYQPQHAIELFTHLCVIAPLSDSKSQSEGQQSRDADQPTPKASSTSSQKYLMPCLLMDLTNIKRFLPQSLVAVSLVAVFLPQSLVAVFVVCFSNDIVPNGIFVGSIACLLSAHGWEVCQKADGILQYLASTQHCCLTRSKFPSKYHLCQCHMTH